MVNHSSDRATIGLRIKQKRLHEDLSIRELARRTNLTASFISQVENEKANVSLESLRRISDALGVQMLYFLSDLGPLPEVVFEEQHSLPVEKQASEYQLFDRTSPIIKNKMRPKLFLPDSGITYELLTSRLDHKMEAFMGQLAPGTGNVAGRLSISTEEFIYCLAGVLKVGIQDQIYILEAGDAIYFDGDSLTCLASGSETEVTHWLSVITPPAF
jgi:transcriptional regulator with XRE-family HTH domain